MRFLRDCMFLCCTFLLTNAVYGQVGEDFDLLRADANDDGTVDQSDAIYILNYLYNGAEAPHCLDAADANDDGFIEDTDFTYIMNWLCHGGPTPPPPGPYYCGADPTPDYLSCQHSLCGRRPDAP